MGLFGGKDITPKEATPSAAALTNSQLEHPLGKNAQQLKSALVFSMGQLANAMTRNDEQKLLSSNLVIMEQNEIIIKYLDDISKKLTEIK